MHPSDPPYKVLLQDPGLFEETVRFVAPELADLLDFETATSLDKEHLTFARWAEAKVAEGVERGVAEGRVALLRRLAGRRFGVDVGGQVGTLLAGVTDVVRLDQAGEWMLECDTGEALLARLRAGRDGTGNGVRG